MDFILSRQVDEFRIQKWHFREVQILLLISIQALWNSLVICIQFDPSSEMLSTLNLMP